MLVDLRAVVEASLAKNAKNAKAAATAKPGATKARAQAAGAVAANSDAPEFEVSAHSPDWSENAPAGQQGADDNNSK